MHTRFGIDFGGVIVKRRAQGPDTTLKPQDGAGIAQPGVFKAVAEIVSLCEDNVWIVSKAGPRTQALTREWLGSVDFFARTGLNEDQLRFCREREDKEGICRELELSHFVDDRVHVMQILRDAVPNLFLFGEDGDQRYCPPWASFVSDWAEIVNLVRRIEPQGS